MKRRIAERIRAEKRHELLTELMERVNGLPIGSSILDVVIHPDGLEALLIIEQGTKE